MGGRRSKRAGPLSRLRPAIFPLPQSRGGGVTERSEAWKRRCRPIRRAGLGAATMRDVGKLRLAERARNRQVGDDGIGFEAGRSLRLIATFTTGGTRRDVPDAAVRRARPRHSPASRAVSIIRRGEKRPAVIGATLTNVVMPRLRTACGPVIMAQMPVLTMNGHRQTFAVRYEPRRLLNHKDRRNP
jgi:hypothetical protein